jgi:hypothetical protein
VEAVARAAGGTTAAGETRLFAAARAAIVLHPQAATLLRAGAATILHLRATFAPVAGLELSTCLVAAGAARAGSLDAGARTLRTTFASAEHLCTCAVALTRGALTPGPGAIGGLGATMVLHPKPHQLLVTRAGVELLPLAAATCVGVALGLLASLAGAVASGFAAFASVGALGTRAVAAVVVHLLRGAATLFPRPVWPLAVGAFVVAGPIARPGTRFVVSANSCRAFGRLVRAVVAPFPCALAPLATLTIRRAFGSPVDLAAVLSRAAILGHRLGERLCCAGGEKQRHEALHHELSHRTCPFVVVVSCTSAERFLTPPIASWAAIRTARVARRRRWP